MLTRPALGNRGVAYCGSGQKGPCERRIHLGTLETEPHALGADSGGPCDDFVEGGVLNLNQRNDVNSRFPFSIPQPPRVFGDTLLLGWASKRMGYIVAQPDNLLAIDARTGEPPREVSFIPEEMIDQTGTATIWTPMFPASELGFVYAPVSSPGPDHQAATGSTRSCRPPP